MATQYFFHREPEYVLNLIRGRCWFGYLSFGFVSERLDPNKIDIWARVRFFGLLEKIDFVSESESWGRILMVDRTQ